MAYVKNTWVDQKVQRPKTYNFTNNDDGSTTLIDAFGNVEELGTPVNADNMNHIEDGLANVGIWTYSATVEYNKDDAVIGIVDDEFVLYKSKQDKNKGNDLSNFDYWENVQLNSSGMPIGTIFPMLCSSSYVPDGALPIDGTEYTKALFPNFYTNFLVAGLLNTCTYDEYASDITTYGQCGKFALDTENGKFKVPTIKDGSYLTQALSDTELGKVYNESLPNIEGRCGFLGLTGNSITSGVFAKINTSAVGAYISGGYKSEVTFDASRSSSTYQNNAKVQGDNVRVRYFVQVANGQINQSDMDWSAFVSALQGKLNKDHSNDEKPYIIETYVNGTSGYNLYNNGYCEQWGRIPGGEDSDYTITLLQPYKNTDYQIGFTSLGNNPATYGATWSLLCIYPIDGSTAGCQRINFERGWFASGYVA